MKTIVDAIDLQFVAAILGLLVLATGVALVFEPGWGLIVLGAAVLLYVLLPDQRKVAS